MPVLKATPTSEQTPQRIKIRVISLDYDGCVAQKALFKPSDSIEVFLTKIIEANKKFLDQLSEENKEFQKVYGFVGSNRQSQDMDSFNAFHNTNGSCYPAIQAIFTHLAEQTPDVPVEFVKLLLADIFAEKDLGYALDEMTKKYDKKDHPLCVNDLSKVTLLYAQMHEIASKNPGRNCL